MPDNALASFLKVAGGLALAAPALSACDRACGTCSAQTAPANPHPASLHPGCGAVSRQSMAQDAATEAPAEDATPAE
ncbi:MAG: hypothetical protein KDE15_02615 [Erythrobacter sp.]|nr:hypothetical protein [Erythrobacter sp.]